MTEEFETVELEYSEDDVLYYLEDEDGTEIGFAIEEDGAVVEYYYEGFDADEYEAVGECEAPAAGAGEAPAAGTREAPAAGAGGTGEAPAAGTGGAGEAAAGAGGADSVEHGYLYKMAAIVGHEGNKTRKVAGEKLDVVRGKAEAQYDKAKKAASDQAGKAKAKADEMDLGISREGVAEATADLNAIAKEGAETAKELKEAYDDIMENFGFLVPKKVRRRLP